MLTHYIEFFSWMLAIQASRAKPLGGTTIPKNFRGGKVFSSDSCPGLLKAYSVEKDSSRVSRDLGIYRVYLNKLTGLLLKKKAQTKA